jgi:MerR family copper efflux transcriptional regulator
MAASHHTIGEFAKLTGLSPRTIDFYTRQGLLHPQQLHNGHGYRRYAEEDRSRVLLIKQLQTRKFSLQEIRRVLDSDGQGNTSSAVEVMERVAVDLERLRNVVQETRSAAVTVNQPALRAVATEALRNATGLSSLIITLLQDMPIL